VADLTEHDPEKRDRFSDKIMREDTQ